MRCARALVVVLGWSLLPACVLPDGDATDFDSAGHPTGTVPRAVAPLRFARACEAGERFTVAAVGDLVLMRPLQEQAFSSPLGPASLWGATAVGLARADVAFANVEGPSAAGLGVDGGAVPDPGPRYDAVVYTEYPRFNLHRTLLEGLAQAGVDVLSTANNHALDRGPAGIDATLEAAHVAGLATTGTRPQGAADAFWSTSPQGRGLRLAWLACTDSTNGLPDPGHQVLRCDRDGDEVERAVRALAADPEVAAVFVVAHAGVEFSHQPTASQRAFAHRVLDAGALVVLGMHPHVLQPWELHQTPDGRETLVVHSLGNFVTSHEPLSRRASALLQLGLTRGPDGRAWLNGMSYVPLVMRLDGGYRVEPTEGAPDAEATSATELVAAVFGPWNGARLDAPVATTPECGP